MAKVENAVSFSVTEVGSVTQEAYHWAFTTKKILSIRDQLLKDNARRRFIGDAPGQVSGNALVRAEILAHLEVSLTETPKDWREAGNGLDLFDENIVLAVYEKVLEIQGNTEKEVSKEAEEGKKKLRAKVKEAKEPAPE